MSYEQYKRSMMQPPQPPPKKGTSCGVKVLIGCGICIFLIALAGLIWVVSLIASPGFLDRSYKYPGSAQHTGQTLPWRTLIEFPTRLRFPTETVIGNFDSDPEHEMIILNQPNGSFILNLSGDKQKITTPSMQWLQRCTAWDFDGDGIDELVCEPDSTGYSVSVFGLDGKVKHVYPGHRMSAFSIVGDYTGDGKPELFLFNQTAFESRIYPQGGGSALSLKIDATKEWPLFLADMDGDGVSEFITSGKKLYQIYSHGKATTQGNWKLFKERSRPVWALDITGDGIDDFLCPNKGYVASTKGYTPLVFDPRVDTTHLASADEFSCEVFYDSPTSPGQIVIVPLGIRNGHVYLFDQNGVMTYDEQMDPWPLGMHVLEENGQDYLVVVTGKKVLVYP